MDGRKRNGQPNRMNVRLVMDVHCQTRPTVWSRLNWKETSQLGCLSVLKMEVLLPRLKEAHGDLLAGNSIVTVSRTLVLPGASFKRPSAATHSPKTKAVSESSPSLCLCVAASFLSVWFGFSLSLSVFSRCVSLILLLYVKVVLYRAEYVPHYLAWGKTRAEPNRLTLWGDQITHFTILYNVKLLRKCEV